MKGKVATPTPVTSSTLDQEQKENLTPDLALTSSKGGSPLKGSSPRKSLIPLPKEKVTTLTRQALTPLQNSGSLKGNEMVGQQKSAETVTKTSSDTKKATSVKKVSISKPSAASTPNAFSKVRSGFVTKRKLVDVDIQTESIDEGVELITGDEPTLAYWKELAETRREALDDALKENEDLHKRVEHLEKENAILEEMMQEAKKLAEIITTMSDEDNPDESGFGGEAESTGFDNDDDSSS